MAALSGSLTRALPGVGEIKSAAKKDISQSELSHRVAVIKRFKELLNAQRDRFREYLTALDKQKNVIESGTTDELLHYVELEEKIVSDIFSIQKVIDPLEEMYKSVRLDNNAESSLKPGGLKPGERKSGEQKSDGEEVFSLKEALDGLKVEAVLRSERNRELLAKRMAELRSEIKSLKSNYVLRRPVSSPTPSLIDLKG
jgi:hypothetical protein